MTFTNTKIDLYPYSDSSHAVIVKNARLANKLNKYLNTYIDYTIKDGEEPMFRFENSKLDYVLVVLGLGKIKSEV